MRRAIAALAAAVRARALPRGRGGARRAPVDAERDGRPNILVVMTDDMATTDLALMPNVQRLLAKQGTTFADAVDSFPLCCPARATFITGQYAHNHGVAGNFYPYGWYGMKKRGNTLPAWLAGRRLPDGADRQVAERLRGARRPRRGPEGLRHLARPARRLRLRLLQLRHEPRRQAAHLGRRRLRPQAGRVREHRGDPGPERRSRTSSPSATRSSGPPPYDYWGTQEPEDYSPDVTGRDHRAASSGPSASRESRSSSGGRPRRRTARTSRRR